MPLSSKTTFIPHPKINLIPNERTPFDHPKCQKEEKKKRQGRDNQYSPCMCEGVAGRRPATPSHKHSLCPPFGFQQVFMWSIASVTMYLWCSGCLAVLWGTQRCSTVFLGAPRWFRVPRVFQRGPRRVRRRTRQRRQPCPFLHRRQLREEKATLQ